MRGRAIYLGATITALIVASALPAPGSAERRSRASDPVPMTSSKVFAFGLRARGEVVRRTPVATVERISVPESVDAAEGGGDALWKVTVRGEFPPRALRYVIHAGDATVGYGVPSGDYREVRTVTNDPSVLSERINAVYEDGTRASALAGSASFTPGDAGNDELAAAASGQFNVRRTVYDLGDQVFQPSRVNRKVELTADVHYPADLSAGPYPLVLFMHGNHGTCYRQRRVTFKWPCPDGWRTLPNYRGYDYIAEHLASFGSIVVSVSANGINVVGARLRSTGMRQRGELIDKHLDLWKRWSTSGGRPFGTRFVGKVDLDRIGTMGHSRGGEGVVWHKIVDEERPDPYGIDAVMALAPVDFTRVRINDVPFAVVLPTCDGDVSDLQGVHFFDDSRYSVPGDPAPKHTVTMFGANHNFFNSVWTPSGRYPGGSDDGEYSRCRSEGLTPVEQRQVGRAYIAKFFRRYLLDDLQLDHVWTGARRPPAGRRARVLVTYLAPDLPDRRMDLSRFTAARELFRNRLGGTVTPRRLSEYRWCANLRISCVASSGGWEDIHRPGLAQGVIAWEKDDARLTFRIPDEHSDVRGFKAFQFRAVTNPAYPTNTRVRRQNLVVELVDGSGNRARVAASAVGNDALVNPLTRRGFDHVILNQVRFPLKLFEGVDLADITKVRLRFSRKPKAPST